MHVFHHVVSPTFRLFCEYTPERLLIWLKKRSGIKLMIAKWMYEPYAWSSKTAK